MVVEPSLPDESEFLYAAQPALLRYRSARLAVAEVMDWYRNRAEEIEHYARQVRPQCCVGCSAFSECLAANCRARDRVRSLQGVKWVFLNICIPLFFASEAFMFFFFDS